MNHNILIVEDDNNLRLTLIDNLEIEGYIVFGAATMAEAKSLMGSESISLCILDIMLPDGNGYEFARWLRKQHCDTLILMLTARILENDVDTGFEVGADDYVNKPCRLKELLLRTKALLRRKRLSSPNTTDIATINDYEINWLSREISGKGAPVHLTKKEFDLLKCLYTHLDQVLSRDEILEQVWGENIFVDNRTVDNFISSLKKRLNLKPGSGYSIKSVRGIGYCLQYKK